MKKLNLYIFAIVIGIFILNVQSVQGTQGITIHYDASTKPNDSSLQSTFSTAVLGGTNWITQGGELTMTTVYRSGIWFGKTSYHDPVPWKIADSSEGNFVSVRSKLGSNSGEWTCHLFDGIYYAQFYFLENGVKIMNPLYSLVINLDPTQYHNYSFEFLLSKRGNLDLIGKGAYWK